MNAAEFHYYPVAFKSDRCVWSCNALNNLSNEVCVPNKTKDLNLTVFGMSAEVNDWKILTKHVSCKCKCKFDERKRNSDQCWNNDKCWCECKERHVCEKDYIWNPSACNFENGKFVASMMDNSRFTCDEIIES